jgi:FkbM family methyltransferase
MAIAIYGAGHFGSCFFQAINDAENKVSYWIDDNLAGGNKNGKAIIKVDEANKDICVIIAVTPLVRSARHLIAQQLTEQGFTNILDFFSAAKKYPSVFKYYAQLSHLWMRPQVKNMIDDTEITWLLSRLADQKSRDVLMKLVGFRQHMDMEHYPEPDRQQEYFPQDIPFLFSKPLKFLDCGAYIGDTVEDFIQLAESGKFVLESIISFEPDTKNFIELNKVIEKRKLVNDVESFITFPAGVWHKNTVLNFSSGMTSSSNVTTVQSMNNTEVSDCNEQVAVVSLDDTCFGFAANFIKMDIEGAEQEALRGCAKIIAKEQPVLAICVYHKPADLWEVPRLIDSLNPNYELYLRVHEHLGLSTVLYCLPKTDLSL